MCIIAVGAEVLSHSATLWKRLRLAPSAAESSRQKEASDDAVECNCWRGPSTLHHCHFLGRLASSLSGILVFHPFITLFPHLCLLSFLSKPSFLILFSSVLFLPCLNPLTPCSLLVPPVSLLFYLLSRLFYLFAHSSMYFQLSLFLLFLYLPTSPSPIIS